MADSCEINNTRSSESEEKSTTEPSAVKRVKEEEAEEDNRNNNERSLLGLSPVEKALRNTLVLQNIFKFVPYYDLQTCQSVDLPLWSSEAEHSISQRPLLIISLGTYEITMNKTLQGQRLRFKFQSISELSLHLQSLEKGHEIWLTVAECNWVPFVTQFKKFICSLNLSSGSLEKHSPSDLQQLLSELPNLSYLRLGYIPSKWKFYNKGLDLPVPLPQIQTLSLRPSYNYNNSTDFYIQVLKDFFQIMPSLKNVHRFPIKLLHMLRLRDCHLNLRSIKSVDMFNSTTPIVGKELNQKLSLFAGLSLKTGLQMAYICLKILSTTKDLSGWKYCCESWTRILRNSQDTLEYLIIEPMALPQYFKYPEMKALKKIRLFSPRPKNEGKMFKFFGEGFDPRKKFPNLAEVHLEATSCSLEEFLQHFPEDPNKIQNYFHGVTSLSLMFRDYQFSSTMEKVAYLFPDVTNLFMDINVRWLDDYLPYIVQLWPKLTSLKFKLDISKRSHGTTDNYLLDPVLTGLSAERCNKLRKDKNKRDINISNYEKSKGISSLTELKKLTLIFYGDGSNTRRVPLLSHVACLYAFQSLPDLEVTCAVSWDNEDDRIQSMIGPIEEYATINPHYY